MNTAQPYERPGIVRHQIGRPQQVRAAAGPARSDAHRRRRDRRPDREVRLAAIRLLGTHAGRTATAISSRRSRGATRGAARLVVQDELPAGDLPRVPPGGGVRRGRLRRSSTTRRSRAASRPSGSTSTGRTSRTTRSSARSRGGSILHIDNLDEIARIERIAQAGGRRARVAIRVNMAIDGVQSWSRFGAEPGVRPGARGDHASSRAARRWISIGLHTHIGTFVQDPQAYGMAASKMAAPRQRAARASTASRVSFIDLGGGFASPNTLKSQYLDGQQASPPFSRYAEAICDGLAELDCPAPQMPTLVLETGRALVDEAGSLISTVQATKRLPDGRRGAGARRRREPAVHRVLVPARRGAGAGGARPRKSPPSSTARCA